MFGQKQVNDTKKQKNTLSFIENVDILNEKEMGSKLQDNISKYPELNNIQFVLHS